MAATTPTDVESKNPSHRSWVHLLLEALHLRHRGKAGDTDSSKYAMRSGSRSLNPEQLESMKKKTQEHDFRWTSKRRRTHDTSPEMTNRFLTLSVRALLDRGLGQTEVVSVTSDVTLATTLDVLAAHNVTSAPIHSVSRGGSQWLVGIIDIEKILQVCVNVFRSDTGCLDAVFFELTLEQLEKSGLLNFSEKWAPVIDTDSLFRVLMVFLMGIHRVTVVDESGRLIGLISQTDVMRLLASDPELLGERASAPALAFGVPRARVETVLDTAVTVTALNRLVNDGVSALAIMNPDTDAIVSSFSANHMKAFRADLLHQLTLPILEFLATRSKEQSLLVPSLSHEATLADVIAFLAQGHHRVWLVDSDMKLYGLLTQSDVTLAICPSDASVKQSILS